MIRFAALVVSLLIVFNLSAQQTPAKIEVKVHNAPLNQVLLGLKEDYGFQFAFDNDLLTKYLISVNRSFSSQEETLTFLIRNLPLKLEKSGDVFLILPVTKSEKKEAVTQISGQVLEARTFEPLPYSYILINRRPVQSDLNGNFNFIASADSSFNLQISHLGYFIYDTIVSRSIHKKFFLIPQIERIKEVQVLSNPIERSTLIGDKAGHMKINHQIAPVLPGHGDNSVFNLLRLLPGIMAAGESSNDLLIWGTYESHSKIQFDGFTVFGLKNFNDNIAVVNPFMVQNIEVLKGGYEARYGERVGGIVDIQGKDGSMLKPTFTFNINSTTINSMVQVPLSEKSSVMGAYRQTYYQLYDPASIRLFTRQRAGSGKRQPSSALDFDVQPDFVFRDANLKYVLRGNNNSRLSVSLYLGGDQFSYNMETELENIIIRRGEEEKNLQMGSSLQYSWPWQNGNTTNVTLAYSAFERQMFERNETEREKSGAIMVNRLVDSENTVNELSLKAEHTLNFQHGHKLLLGAGALNNQVQLSRFWNNEQVIAINNQSPRLYVYLQDELPLAKIVEIKSGIRTTYLSELNKWYFEPRLAASVMLTDEVKLNAAWGLYKQFLSKTTVVDTSFNFTQFWTNADETQVPVLNAEHFVAGISYNYNGFTFSTEAFYKTTEGLNRFFNGIRDVDRGFYVGEAIAKGLDLFLKKEYKTHMAWISYTLSDTKEHFPIYIKNEWQPAPQQQRHELKLAGIFNYKSFYFSANYVYGSGFERFNIEPETDEYLNQPYKRLDASVVYKFKPGKVKAEAGISVLNVLNTQNIKYSNINISTIDEVNLLGVYADAVTFTPALFFKIEF